MAEEYSLSINDYITIARRRALLMAITFVVVIAIAVVVSLALKPVYQSTGTILVESPTVSTDLIQGGPADLVDEQIEVIRQRVLTRDNLNKIIDKFRLFKDDSKSLSYSEKVDLFRRNVIVEPLRSTAKGRRNGVTYAFKLSYEDSSPQVAYGVASDLVTLFLNENVRAKSERASEATEFLGQEADRIKKEVEALESKISSYKQRHGTSTPDNSAVLFAALSRTETDLGRITNDHQVALDELKTLELEAEYAKAKKGGGTAKAANDLDAMKAERERLLSIYKVTHPDVRALTRKIEAGEHTQAASGSDANATEGRGESLDEQAQKIKLSLARERVQRLDQQQRTVRARLEQIERQMTQVPEAERGLASMMREHEGAQKQYNEIRAKQMSAQVSENLVQENKADRFALIDPPVLPEKPIRPDRVKILLLGFLASLGAPIGLVFALETVNQRVRGANALAAVLRHRPMATIPYITTREQIALRKKSVRYGIVIFIILIGLAIGLTHKFYMPLDILWFKILGRFA